MIKPKTLFDKLKLRGTDYYLGVPDSLLKNFCAYITDNVPESNHIITANEGSAIALASGYHLATNKIPLVYMQNSGEGNSVNPLLSLCDKEVYSIPILLLIGLRGEVGVKDEPQHVKQGRVTRAILDAMEIPNEILSNDENELDKQLDKAYQCMTEQSAPYALIVRKGTFDDYTLKTQSSSLLEMKREDAIEEIILNSPRNAAFVSTTGMISRELYELRDKYDLGHAKDFLTVGSMGHASSIALSIALQLEEKPIYCIDGDGAVIMHMGSMATIGVRAPRNFVHIVLNNGAHDSVGGQPTVGLNINLMGVSLALGYKKAYSVSSKEEMINVLKDVNKSFKEGTNELTFLEIKVKKGARKDLGRPKSSPLENKKAFMEELKR